MKPKLRHKIIINLARPFVVLFVRQKYGYKALKYPALKNETFLLVSNHITQIDPLLVSASFRQHIYYVATDNVIKRNWLGKVLSFACGPIPKTKNTIDISTIKNMLSMVSNGGCVGLFLSGNATYSGSEEYIPSPIAKLVKKINKPLVIYNLIGGYGVAPRWGNEIRKGKFYGKIKQIVMPEEYLAMSDEQLEDLIKNQLAVSAFQDIDQVGYDCKNRAEYLERALFWCPDCHSFSTLTSNGHNLSCSKCGYKIRYETDLTFTLLQGKHKIDNVKQWYDLEKNYVANYDFAVYNDEEVIIKDADILCRQIRGTTSWVSRGSIALYNSRIEINSEENRIIIPLEKIISMAAQSKNNLLFHTNTDYYEIDGNVRRSALAYLFIYYSISNRRAGVKNGFLGI